MYAIATIGQIGDADPPAEGRALDVFEGCSRPNQVAAYLAAQAFERQTKGFALGFAIGVAACGVAFLYFRTVGKV